MLEPDYRGREQLGAGYNIGLGLQGKDSWPAFTLKSPGSEPIEFEPPTPNPFRPELTNPKPDAANAFKPVPSNPKPRKPKAPKSNAKPNKFGTNDNSSPPKEFSPWKEVLPQSNWRASPNRGVPKREAFDLFREWESEEWLNEELRNRESPKFEVSRLRSKKDFDLNEFAAED